MRFENKVAMVTGASVGIGRACAVRLAKEGAKLVLFDINAEQLDKVKEEVAPYTTDVLTYTCDVSDEAAVNAAVADAMQHFGRIDVLINNAAIWRTWKTFMAVTTEEWKSSSTSTSWAWSIAPRGARFDDRASLRQDRERRLGRRHLRQRAYVPLFRNEGRDYFADRRTRQGSCEGRRAGQLRFARHGQLIEGRGHGRIHVVRALLHGALGHGQRKCQPDLLYGKR